MERSDIWDRCSRISLTLNAGYRSFRILLRQIARGAGAAEGRERKIHRSRLVGIFAVADSELFLIGALPRRIELGQEISLAPLLHRGAERHVAACPPGAVLEQLVGRRARGRLPQRVLYH